MKKIVWLIIFVAVLLLGLPGLLGILAERETNKQLSLTQGNPGISLTISEYDRGWFSSDVTYRLGLSDSYVKLLENAGKPDDSGDASGLDDNNQNKEAAALIAGLEMVSKVTHGPVGMHDGVFLGLFRAETTNGDKNPTLNDFLKRVGMPHLFHGMSTTSFFGSTNFTASMPAANADPSTLGQNTELRSVEFSGLTMSGTHQSGSNAMTMEGQSDSLSIVSDGSSMGMEGFSVSGDLDSVSSKMAFGTVKAKIQSMSIFDATADTPERFEANGFTFDADTQRGSAEGTADFVARYLIDSITVGDQAVTDMEVAIQMDSLSIAAMDAYTKLSEEFVASAAEASGSDGDTDPAMDLEFLGKIQPLVHEFASKSPMLNVNPIKFTANDETFLASLAINLDGSVLPTVDTFDLANVPMWMSMASAEAGLNISETLATSMAVSSARGQIEEQFGDQQGIDEKMLDDMAAAQAPMILESLVQQGMIQREAGNLSAKLSFDNGELLLNGQPLPLGALMGAMQ